LKRLDQIEIYQLLSTYGPCADSGSGDIVETLYKGDGKYDSGSTHSTVRRRSER